MSIRNQPENRFQTRPDHYSITSVFNRVYIFDLSLIVQVPPIPRPVVLNLRVINEQIDLLRRSHSERHSFPPGLFGGPFNQSYRLSIPWTWPYIGGLSTSTDRLLSDTEGLELIARLPVVPCAYCVQHTYVDDSFGPTHTPGNLCSVCEFTSQTLLRLQRMESNYIGLDVWIRQQEFASGRPSILAIEDHIVSFVGSGIDRHPRITREITQRYIQSILYL